MQAGECRHRNSKLRHTCPVDGGKSFRICSVWVGLVFQEHLSHRICVRLYKQHSTVTQMSCHVSHTSVYAPANRCIENISLLAFNFSLNTPSEDTDTDTERNRHTQKRSCACFCLYFFFHFRTSSSSIQAHMSAVKSLGESDGKRNFEDFLSNLVSRDRGGSPKGACAPGL